MTARAAARHAAGRCPTRNWRPPRPPRPPPPSPRQAPAKPPPGGGTSPRCRRILHAERQALVAVFARRRQDRAKAGFDQPLGLAAFGLLLGASDVRGAPTALLYLGWYTPAVFALYLVALIVAWIVTWSTESLTANSWFQFFLFTTIAYILSRGIAKASRVLEQ